MVALTAVILISTATFATGKEFKSASSLENATEQNLKIENWMVDFSKWNHTSVYHILPASDKMTSLEFWMIHPAVWEAGINAAEEVLPLEAWMTSPGLWDAFADVAEEQSVLEAWMVEDACWTVKTPEITPATDGKLSLEAWMTSAENWK